MELHLILPHHLAQRDDLTNPVGVDLTARQRNLTMPVRLDLTALIKGDYHIDIRERMRAYHLSPRMWAVEGRAPRRKPGVWNRNVMEPRRMSRWQNAAMKDVIPKTRMLLYYIQCASLFRCVSMAYCITHDAILLRELQEFILHTHF